MSIRNKKLLTALLVVMFSSAPVFADDAAVTGREGQAFGNQLSGSMRFPTESGGMIEFGDESINPSEFAPSGDGFYVQDPNVGGMQGIYDSDYDMDVTGRATQGKLYSDAQAMGNPFDPDPTKRNDPGPSTVSGAAYQIVLGVSGAREKFPDLTNDPIVVGSGQAMVDEDLLESFGDCSVETEVTESTRPVRVPEEEFCERVTKPAASSCQVKREIEVSSTIGDDGFTQSGTTTFGNGFFIDGRAGQAICNGAYRSYVITGSAIRNPSLALCANGVALFTSSIGRPPYSWTITIITGTKTVHTITRDRWYPEECVARAQRG